MNDIKIISDTKKYLDIVDKINQKENDIDSINEKIEYSEKYQRKYSDKILPNITSHKEMKETIKFLKMDIFELNKKLSGLNINFEIYNRYVN